MQMENYRKLTNKEEEIMNFFWEKGALFVRSIVEMYNEPKPHFNTVSTMVRALESYGYLSHKVCGNTYEYYPVVTARQYSEATLDAVVGRYFNGSYRSVVETFVESGHLTAEELEKISEKLISR